MTDTLALTDPRLAQEPVIEIPFAEREYTSTLAGLMKLYIPPYSVIRLVDEADIRIPPPPESIVAFLERTAETQPVSVEAGNWLRQARAAVEAAKEEAPVRDEATERWLQRVKAARPATKTGANE